MYVVPQVAESLPRICFLSGLSGEEMKMFIETPLQYHVSDLEVDIFNMYMFIILILMITNFKWFLIKMVELFLNKRKP